MIRVVIWAGGYAIGISRRFWLEAIRMIILADMNGMVLYGILWPMTPTVIRTGKYARGIFRKPRLIGILAVVWVWVCTVSIFGGS